MIYRIRYKTEMGTNSQEASVEANSPAEAVVKFRLIQPDTSGAANSSDSVTSVCPEISGLGGDF